MYQTDDQMNTVDERLGKVRAYDFKKANKFPKEQMRTLHIIYDGFARQLSSYLSGTLRTMCEVGIVSVEEHTYYDFINALPSPVLLAVINLMPLHGPTLLEISPDIAYYIIDRLLGGSGEFCNKERTFTEMELVILERITRQMLPLLNDAWEKIVRVDACLARVETSAQFAQIVNINETIAIINMQVKTSDIVGNINFCIPHLSIEPISKMLNTRLLFSGNTATRDNDNGQENIRQHLRNTTVCVSAVLAETTMTTDEILSLEVGDVIQLDTHIKDEIPVRIEQLPKGAGRLGVMCGKYAVKLTSLTREENNTDE